MRFVVESWRRVPLPWRMASTFVVWLGIINVAGPLGLRALGDALRVPRYPPAPFNLLGLVLFLPGLLAAGLCALQFYIWGRGTPSPYDPPVNLVIVGPYQYSRNPMMMGQFVALSGEAILLRSPFFLAILVPIALLAHFYVTRFEERHLLARFGEAYEEYRRHVPRWLPRLTPYRQNHRQ